MIAQDNRARLACPTSPGSSAQDHRAHLYAQDHPVYEQRPTESDDKINGGTDCCCDPEEEHEENGIRGASARARSVLYLQEA